MLFERNYRSESPFTIMLAEEVFRAELRKLYGEKVKIFRRDISAPSLANVFRFNDPGDVVKRIVTIKAIVGPFENIFEPSYEGDKRGNTMRVSANCTLQATKGEAGGQATLWRPERIYITCNGTRVVKPAKHLVIYDRPDLKGRNSMLGDYAATEAENPCADMCASQFSIDYPEGYRQMFEAS